MAIELAKAYLPIIPSLGKGFKGNLEKEIFGALIPSGESAGAALGKKLGDSTSASFTKEAGGIAKKISSDLSKNLGSSFKGFGGEISEIFSRELNLSEPFKKAADKLAPLASKLAKPLTEPAQAFVNSARDAVSTAQGHFRTGFDAMAAQATSVASLMMRPGQNFVNGLRSTEAAQSSFTGRMGTLGGRVSVLGQAMATPGRSFTEGLRGTSKEESAFTSRISGISRRTGALAGVMLRPGQNFINGLRSSEAAQSSFTGRMGTIGGQVGDLGRAFGRLGGNIKSSFAGAFSGVSFKELVDKADAAGHESGERIKRGIKLGATVAAGAITGVLGAALVKGFGRLSAIENAEAKLSGLGNTADDVSSIMDNALGAVKGTAFGMDEAATTAASAVAAGIKPGMELEKYLGLVGDAATIAGVSMSDMGSIFNKVATSGKVQGDVFAQLSDAGIPVVQMLAEEMGITAEEVYKLGSAGEIGSDTFLAAMGSMEGAALKGGETTSGAFKNMNAALGRFGAALLEDIFPLVGPVFGFITEKIDIATTAVKPLAEMVAVWLVGAFQSARDVVANFGQTITDNWNVIGPILAGVGAAVATFLAWQGALKLVTWATTLWGAATTIAGTALKFITSPLGITVLAIGALTAGIIWAYNNIGWFRDLVQVAWSQIQIAIGFVVDWWTTTAWPAIQTGLQVLGQWFTWLWQTVVVPAWNAIAAVIMAAWVNYIQPALTAVWGFIQGTLAPIFMWLWQSIIVPVFTAIVAIIQWAWTTIIIPLLGFVVAFVKNVLAPVFMWLWQNIITPVWNGIVLAIKVAWAIIEVVFGLINGFLRGVLGPAFTWFKDNVISPVWDWISDKISRVGDFLTGTVFPKLGDGLEWLQRVFEKVKDGIGKVWEGLKAIVQEPIRAVVNGVINDGLIAGYNKLNNFWTDNDNEGNIPRIELGFRKGGYTGNFGKDKVAGVVHGQEHVTRAESTARVNREHPGFLDALNRTGSVAGALGFASGGHRHGVGAHCAHCAASGAAVGHSTTASTAGAPPSGPSGIWGGFQAQISRAGKLFVPKMRFMGVDTENVARAWMGRSAVEIVAGNGSPSVSFATGGQGTYGFNSGSQIWMQNAVPGNLREAVLIHELGHALSLHHTMNTGSIMHPLQAGPTWPSGLDYGSLVRAWGKPGEGVTTFEGGNSGPSWLGKVAEWLSTPVRKLLGTARERAGGNGFYEMPIGIAGKALDSLVDSIGRIGGSKASMGVKPALFDNGGIIDRGVQIIDHQRATPDYVLTDTQWAAMLKLAEVAESNTNAQGATVNVVVPEREGIDPSTLGSRVGESVAWHLSKAGI